MADKERTTTINGDLKLKDDRVFGDKDGEGENVVVKGNIISDGYSITVYDGNLRAHDIRLAGGSINALNIYAHNIDAHNIDASNIYVTGNINLSGDIRAGKISARNIDARNILADHIKVIDNLKVVDVIVDGTISASNIYYYAICIAYQNLTYNTIHHERPNAIHLALDKVPGAKKLDLPHDVIY
ncbi:MAG: hypothetical protein QW478_08830 [Candidatus Micrarchaeaceae archaeon]